MRPTSLLTFASSLLLSLLASCQGPAATVTIAFRCETPVERGAAEFRPGDEVVIESVHSDSEGLAPGATMLVTGHYTLASQDEARLRLGTTVTVTGGEPRAVSDSKLQAVDATRGQHRFSLVHTMTAPGYLHLSFYDLASGRTFGGVYFGQGGAVLREKSWSYMGEK